MTVSPSSRGGKRSGDPRASGRACGWAETSNAAYHRASASSAEEPEANGEPRGRFCRLAAFVGPATVSSGGELRGRMPGRFGGRALHEILEKRNVVLHGHVVLLKVGKVVDGRSFDIARLKAEGVKLRRLE